MSELQDTIKSNGLANLKKGDKVLALHLGFPIEAELLEKPRNHVTLVMLTNADKFNLFNSDLISSIIASCVLLSTANVSF